MVETIKIIGTEISIATANTVSLAPLLRILNASGSVSVLTVRDPVANTTVTASIPADGVMFIRKPASHTVQGTSLLATAVS